MSGSESKSEPETNGSSPTETDRISLADFLAPPRSRISVPAPAPKPVPEAAANGEGTQAAPAAREIAPPEGTGATVAPAEIAAAAESTPTTASAEVPVAVAEVAVAEVAPAAGSIAEAALSATEAISTAETTSAAEATTPIAPETVSDAPPGPAAVVLARASEPRPSVAPPSSSDAQARSLIPVATSATSDAPEDDVADEFDVPGASPPWSSAAIRRVTFVALLAAAAAVPAWVVFRARSVDVQARTEASTQKNAAASAGPSTLQPAREIEADDDPAESEPVVTAVPVDPVKGLELRREARRLLEAGQIDQGVATARRAIEANPADPECYVLLAAGLQDQGRWAESRDVFSRCVRKSEKGINAECLYFASSATTTNR